VNLKPGLDLYYLLKFKLISFYEACTTDDTSIRYTYLSCLNTYDRYVLGEVKLVFNYQIIPEVMHPLIFPWAHLHQKYLL